MFQPFSVPIVELIYQFKIEQEFVWLIISGNEKNKEKEK